MAPAQVPNVGLSADKLLELLESGFAQQFQKRARFAPWNHQAIHCGQLLGLFDENDLGAQLLEPATVSIKIALQGKYTDLHTNFILVDHPVQPV